ncbi:MAG: DUF1837 domain-containing protein [Christensenella sp.]|uniref:HamA C-terminal domain-containing protein n=1 Tax=Christensenella sp. TaxID=1935934 RepID=UPI002B21F16E|nr:DUF1837 domain-containing protein [Christensenella sp.]MEA5004038.1 DUF1837 domain-containing protein [Christensenella sp.]
MATTSPIKNTSKGDRFNSIFVEVCSKSMEFTNPNCVRIFSLDIQNNSFSYVGLHQLLQNNIGRYVFSRAAIERFYLDDETEAISAKALELLRAANNPHDCGAGGELGEILLYLFLEQNLNAPKILSKMELKSSENQYVYGSDGVHLLFCSDSSGKALCQLVLGESKIVGSLTSAIDDAFKSITKVIDTPDNELRLIESNIFKESFDKETADYLKQLIIPTKRDLNMPIDKAFGIFLGYTIELDSALFSNAEYRIALQKKMIDDITKHTSYIEAKIKKQNLNAYSFYFYILPFDNAAKDRADIINKLKGK